MPEATEQGGTRYPRRPDLFMITPIVLAIEVLRRQTAREFTARCVVLDLSAVYNSEAIGILMICAAAFQRAVINDLRDLAEAGEQGTRKIISVVIHRLSDLQAAGAACSRERALAEGLLVPGRRPARRRRNPGDLRPGHRPARLDRRHPAPHRHRNRTVARARPRRGPVEGRPALLHRPPSPLARRRSPQQHQRPHDSARRAMTPEIVVSPSLAAFTLAVWILAGDVRSGDEAPTDGELTRFHAVGPGA